MLYTNLVYNLLPNLFWTITPALPRGAAGNRLAVGVPEPIPDFTFVTRDVVAGDGIEPAAERNRLNGFVQKGRAFHKVYGLAPVDIDSFDDILKKFQDPNTPPIDRIRLVSHGDDAFVFVPVFTNGSWDRGMDDVWLKALQASDETGLRFLIANPPQSPVLVDRVDIIVDGIRARGAPHDAVLSPFALQASGHPAAHAPERDYFEIVNDLFQVANGTLVTDSALLSVAQRNLLTASFNIMEASVRERVKAAVPALTDAHLLALKTEVLGATPVDLEFLGPKRDLATTAQAVNNAIAGGVEDDIRIAIMGSPSKPVFLVDYLAGLVQVLEVLQPGVLRGVLSFGGVDHDFASISDLEAFCQVAMDLNYLRHRGVLVNGAAPTTSEQTAIRNGLLAIASIIRTRIRAANPGITAAKLNALRDAIDKRPLRETGITGGAQQIFVDVFRELKAANTAMQGGFRARLDHFRGLMRASDASHFDIRGCEIGADPDFLNVLRDFLGGTHKPAVTAPEWFQGYAVGGVFGQFDQPTVFFAIDDFVLHGSGAADITGANVGAALIKWSALIDFDPHFDFIADLFRVGRSQLDFASLAWRKWRVPPAATGIPILRMEAARIDDIDTLPTLGDVILRFQTIFEIPAASTPNPAAQLRLNVAQPHVAAFAVINDALTAAAPGPPTQVQLDKFVSDLSALVATAGFPPPAVPFNAPPAPASLLAVQGFANAIQTHLEGVLRLDLDPFFGAMQGPNALGHANAPIRYFYSIGLPLLVKSGIHPATVRLSVFASGPNKAARDALAAKALRSWMRIQWTGTAAQTMAMKTVTDLAISDETQRNNAARRAMLAKKVPTDDPTAPSEVSPMPGFDAHIVKKP